MKASILLLVLAAAETAIAQAPIAQAQITQAPIAQALPAPCDSAALRTPIGTQTDTLRVFLRRADLSSPLPSGWALSALDGVRQAFTFPSQMSFAAYVGGTAPGTAVATARSTLLFDARKDGTVRIGGMLSRSGSDLLDASLAAAIRAAGEQRAFAPLPAGQNRDMALVAELYFGIGDSLRAGMDVAALQLPVYRDFTGPVPPKPSEVVSPDESLVQALAMVGGDGRVRKGHVDFYSARYPRFAGYLIQQLDRLRSVPARIAGCAVPTLVLFVLEPPR